MAATCFELLELQGNIGHSLINILKISSYLTSYVHIIYEKETIHK